MWLVGGGTSPGSGLPTIYQSGRITANFIRKKYDLDYEFAASNLERNFPEDRYEKYL